MMFDISLEELEKQDSISKLNCHSTSLQLNNSIGSASKKTTFGYLYAI